MKKVFFVAGELSGDHIAAWYLAKLQQQEQDLVVHAVGGDGLAAQGAHLYVRFEQLNVVGIVEILKHLPFLFRFIKKLCTYIKTEGFDEVVLVDFPGFNLWLARKLKSKNPGIRITYVSPPQMWCWGAWRVKKLKKYCDHVVVMYPFEVAWYGRRGVKAHFLGNPVFEGLKPYIKPHKCSDCHVALIPGSRGAEIETLWPIFLQTAQLLLQRNPNMRFIVPVAKSIGRSMLVAIAQQHRFESVLVNIHFVDEQEKWTQLSQCCVALSKPGTVTLELALLKVPTIIAYKTSWLTYWIAWFVVKVPFMGLPNLFAGKQVFLERLQDQCRSAVLAKDIEHLLHARAVGSYEYRALVKQLDAIEHTFDVGT